MRYAIRYVLSLLFIIQMYLAMPIMAIWFTPFTIFSRQWSYKAVRAYSRWVMWTAGWMVGLKSEVRGDPPQDEVLICAKHQSFMDILLIITAVPRPRFVMKKSLRWAPVLGWYAIRMGCISVDRGKKAKAVQQMIDGVKISRQTPGQLIIYPQGTRVAPGVAKPYKVGPGILYEGLDQPCVPVATNVGVFWPRHGIYRKPGLAVVEFLPRIMPGLGLRPFMAELEAVVESNSNRLMREAGFDISDRPDIPDRPEGTGDTGK